MSPEQWLIAKLQRLEKLEHDFRGWTPELQLAFKSLDDAKAGTAEESLSVRVRKLVEEVHALRSMVGRTCTFDRSVLVDDQQPNGSPEENHQGN